MDNRDGSKHSLDAKRQQVAEVLRALKAEADPDWEPGDDAGPIAFLRQYIEELPGLLEVRERPLDAVEAMAFNITSNSLKELVEEFDLTDDQMVSWAKIPSSDKAARCRLIRRWVEDHPERLALLQERSLSSRISVHPMGAPDLPTAGELTEAMVATAGPEVLKQLVPIASSRMQLVSMTSDADGRLRLTYERRTRTQQTLDAERRPVHNPGLERATLVVNCAEKTIEGRGSTSAVGMALDRFKWDLSEADIKLDLESLVLTDVEYAALKQRLKLKMKTEVWLPPDEEARGIGRSSASVSQKYTGGSGCLSETLGYKNLDPDREITQWDLTVPFEGNLYSVKLNRQHGRFQVRQGNVKEALVRYLVDEIRKLRRDQADE